MNINRVVLTGNLTRDPEIRAVGDSSVCDLGLAVNAQEKRDGEWQDRADFFDVTVWGSAAERAVKYLSKGSPIAVEGKLRQDTWEKDGQKRSKVKVVASFVQYLPNGRKESNGNGGTEEDIPF